jgi:murein DD-endopeptidase MepM/ murein hydrolase activator NlpD
MHKLAVDLTRTRTFATIAENGPPSGASFQEHLTGAVGAGSATPAATVVRQGDCLSKLCAERLREQTGAASHRQVQVAVQAVARANHLTNPDRIQVGQALDLSMLGPATAIPTSSLAPPTPALPAPWQSLVTGGAVLSSDFGLRKDPFTGQLRQHNGIDLAAATGSPVTACAAGSVVFAGWQRGYGNTVIIHHANGLDSLYGHLSRTRVQVGDQVASHAPIADVGGVGRATGPHLHFEIRRDGKAVAPDPETIGLVLRRSVS